MLTLLNKSIIYKDRPTIIRIQRWNYLYVYPVQPYIKNVNVNLLYSTNKIW
jgi:hypothetical protein